MLELQQYLQYMYNIISNSLVIMMVAIADKIKVWHTFDWYILVP